MFWYFVFVASVSYLAGLGSGAAIWRNNAKRFETLLKEGKDVIGSFRGIGKQG